MFSGKRICHTLPVSERTGAVRLFAWNWQFWIVQGILQAVHCLAAAGIAVYAMLGAMHPSVSATCLHGQKTVFCTKVVLAQAVVVVLGGSMLL
jgi:uncharacterized SAM-binding protein YcdF (DUF218 family)